MNLEAVTQRRSTFTLPDGREITLQSLGLRDFAQAREQALAHYRRSLIKAWTENADQMPADMRQDMVQKAFERAAALTIDALPKKLVKTPKRDARGVLITDHEGQPVIDEQEHEYPVWWMSEDLDGQIYTAWLSMTKVESQKHLTLAEVSDILMSMLGSSEQVAQKIGELSEPRIQGNGQAPPSSDSTEGKTPQAT